MKNLLKEVKGNIYGLGCYCFKADGRVLYVGSGMINDRLQAHLYNLKRGLYEGTNKDVLQHKYNLGELSFEVLHFSENNSIYLHGTYEEKKSIQESLEVLEQFYYDMYKDTVCNKMSKIRKWSTSPSIECTNKRKNSNTGIKNPNCKYSEELISEILWMKMNGYKPRHIRELIENNYNIDIKNTYINQIGINKWIYLKEKKPTWLTNEAI